MRPRAKSATQFILSEKSDVTLVLAEGRESIFGGQSLFNSRHGAINNQRGPKPLVPNCRLGFPLPDEQERERGPKGDNCPPSLPPSLMSGSNSGEKCRLSSTGVSLADLLRVIFGAVECCVNSSNLGIVNNDSSKSKGIVSFSSGKLPNEWNDFGL